MVVKFSIRNCDYEYIYFSWRKYGNIRKEIRCFEGNYKI